MAELFKSKQNEFYITKQERYYSPGEDILGEVVLDLKKASRTNNIKVVLEGMIEMGGRNISLFTKSVTIAESPDGDKSYYLEPFTHRFPFLITIPTQNECSVPSTLEIPKLLKVSYRLVAIYNKSLMLEKFCPTTSSEVTILEKIDVEDADFSGEQKNEKELVLTGETREVKVSTIVGKRAAVKGDVVPISIKIEHIGVIVRDKAISVQLLRSVYYGKNKSELFGPKAVREISANIQISGPINFTKTFDLQLAIPPQLCPTVAKSSTSFEIEYSLRVAVNLNEENPHRPETEGDIVMFNFPFTIGTYPRLAFNIDDDDDETETVQSDYITSNHSSEYDQVAEKMKDLDLGTCPPQMVQEGKSVTPIDPNSAPSSSSNDITPLKRLEETGVNNSEDLPSGYLVPEPAMNKPNTSDEEQVSTPEMKSHSLITSEPALYTNNHTFPVSSTPSPELLTKPLASPPLTRPNLQINPSEMFNDYQPIVSPTGPPSSPPLMQAAAMRPSNSSSTMRPSNSSSTMDSGLGRQESVRWIVRNQEAAAPAAVAASTSPNIPPCLPPRPTTPINNPGLVMPTPSVSQPTTSSFLHHKNYYGQAGAQHSNSSNYHLQPSLSSQTSNRPMQQHQYPPYTNNNANDQYHQYPPYPNNSTNDQYRPYPPYINNNTNHHPQPGYFQHYDYTNNHHSQHNNNNNIAFPVPQHPGFLGQFIGMPSHQNYQHQTSTYYNH